MLHCGFWKALKSILFQKAENMGDQKNTQIKAKMTFYLSLSRVRNMIIFVAFVLHKIVVVWLYFTRAGFRLEQ